MTNSSIAEQEFSSFRDPSGHVFSRAGVLYRQINTSYIFQYRKLMDCGLYEELQKYHALIPHEETNEMGITASCALVIRPEKVPFISYPYEWTFAQLKDAALLTLKLHRRAMNHGMILKDASAYNVQFIRGKAMLIDTLSFDNYTDGEPWRAYGQFCRHFLAPLLLMHNIDPRMNKMLTVYIDGIPLDLASTLLKGKGGMLAKLHIHWHAKSIEKHAEDGKHGVVVENIHKGLSKRNHLMLIESLIHGIEEMDLGDVYTEWSDYYAHTNYSDEAATAKGKLVREYLQEIAVKTVWDLGANDGTYSRLAVEQGAQVVAFDIDPAAVSRNYSYVKKEKLDMLPLVLDLTNPSPGIGFANRERRTVPERQKPDCILALALIHHLAISNNLPLTMLAQWFAELCHYLIIEFVPKEDSQVQLLLSTREDIFPTYAKEEFVSAFTEYFTLRRAEEIPHGSRMLYLWEVRNGRKDSKTD